MLEYAVMMMMMMVGVFKCWLDLLTCEWGI